MSNLPTISEAEYQVMKLVWKKAPISTTEVVEELAKTTSWKPKTIQTLLARLVKKSILAYQKEGRVFVYTPIIEESTYLEQESETFLKRFYNGTLGSMVVSFLEEERLSQDEIKTLRDMLERKTTKGGV